MYQKKRDKFLFPGWLFVLLMVLYNEIMLHVWITEEYQIWRFLAVVLFAGGFGFLLSVVSSLMPSGKAVKISAMVLGGLVSAVWLTMYFISDAYQVFMTPATIIGGAGGVATDYMDLIVSLVVRNLWRIALMLLPVLLYGLFCRCEKNGWKLRTHMALIASYLYLLGFVVSNGPAGDAARFDTAYNFDSAVRCMGLNMSFILETSGAGAQEAPDFVTVPETPTVIQTPAETQPAAEDSTGEPGEETVVYGDQVMAGLDFAELAQTETNSKIRGVYQYLASMAPEKKNEYTGLFAGKNLILITAEAFSAEVIDPELTPTLYRLANQGIRFTDYYQPAWGASTIGGEFSNLMGIVPTNGGDCMNEVRQQNMFLTIGNQLKAQGYYSLAYHNNDKSFYNRDTTHNRFGYDEFRAQFGGLDGLSPDWPQSDLEMIDISVPDYIDKQPFSIYYMTVSGHSVYSQKGHAQARKNYDLVADLPYSETIKCYLAAQLELEKALTSLVMQLEEAGIADDTVIVLATDHYPYGLAKSQTWKNAEDHLANFYGVEFCDLFTRDHNALIIWSGCLEGQEIVVEDPVFSLDILPTISNLFGVEYDSRLLVGRDVLSQAEPIIFWPDHSWKTDKGTYNANDKTFTPKEGVTVEEGYIERINAIVDNKIAYSVSVLSLNLFNEFDAARKAE